MSSAVLLSMTPPGPQNRRTADVLSGYAIRQGRGAGAVTPGWFLRSFTRGNVWLAEAMTGHLGHEKHDRPGRAAAGAAEDHHRG